MFKNHQHYTSQHIQELPNDMEECQWNKYFSWRFNEVTEDKVWFKNTFLYEMKQGAFVSVSWNENVCSPLPLKYWKLKKQQNDEINKP